MRARLTYATQRLACCASAGAFVFFTSKYAGTLHAFSVAVSFVSNVLQIRGTTNLVINCMRDLQVLPTKTKIWSRGLKLAQRGGKTKLTILISEFVMFNVNMYVIVFFFLSRNTDFQIGLTKLFYYAVLWLVWFLLHTVY